MIRDTEENCGIQPVQPMDGKGGRRVGYTVDTSVDLGNSSHFDSNDASQGYSLLGEEVPGRGTIWYLVMPNNHGCRPGANFTWVPFAGLAFMITNGVSLSWDGRDIRHCTSVLEPEGRPVGESADDCAGGVQQTENHLYGTFTAAKERVVEVRKKASAAKAAAARAKQPNPAAAATIGTVGAKKKRRRQKNRKRSHRGRGHVK